VISRKRKRERERERKRENEVTKINLEQTVVSGQEGVTYRIRTKKVISDESENYSDDDDVD
jgi:hypothetical protein